VPGASHAVALAGRGCPMPDAWAWFQTSLPCPSLGTSMNQSVCHLCIDTMVRTLLSARLAGSERALRQASPSEHTEHLPHWGHHCNCWHNHGGNISSAHLVLFQNSSWIFSTTLRHSCLQQYRGSPARHGNLEGNPLPTGTKHSHAPAIKEKILYFFPWDMSSE